MKVNIHKGKTLGGISTGFIKNAAVFTAEEGLALGDFYKLTLPFHNLYVTTSPEIIQKAFVANGEKYQKSKIYWKQLKAVTGNSIGTLEGKQWIELKTLEQQFYKPSAIQECLTAIGATIEKHLINWKKESPPGNEFDVSVLFSQLNIEIILKTVFGFSDFENLPGLAKAIEDGENIIAWRSKYPWRPFTGWLTGQNYSAKKDLKVFDDYIRKNFNDAAPESLTRVLYNSLPSSFTEKEKLQRIRNELIVHLGAGTETAAVSLTWTLYLLNRHPEVLAKLEAEVNKYQSDDIENVKEILMNLPYLQQVLNESLRLYPPSHAIVRDCVLEDTIAGQKIKKGTTIFASVYAFHRNPRLWQEPELFKPERFSEEAKSKIPDYAFIPFGVGKHTCIGRYLAMPILSLTLYKLLRNFKILPNNAAMLKPVTLSTLKPESAVRIKLIQIPGTGSERKFLKWIS